MVSLIGGAEWGVDFFRCDLIGLTACCFRVQQELPGRVEQGPSFL